MLESISLIIISKFERDGVNEGIRRFKEKWGGIPTLRYAFCEAHYGYTRTASLIRDLAERL